MVSNGGSTTALIITYHRPEHLRRLLRSLCKCPSIAHVVVVDNSSRVSIGHDEAERIVGDRTVDIISQPWNPGIGASVQRGLDAVSLGRSRPSGVHGVLVLDDDTVVREALVRDLRGALAEPRVGISTVQTEASARYSTHRYTLAPWSPMLIDIAEIGEVRPRSDLFFTLDDWEFCVRLQRAGLRIGLVDNSPGLMPLQSEGEYWDGRSFLGARNAARLILDGGPGRTIWLRYLVAIGRSSLLHPHRRRLARLGVAAALRGHMGRPPDAAAKRSRSPADQHGCSGSDGEG